MKSLANRLFLFIFIPISIHVLLSLFFFTGLALGDDVIYYSQVLALSRGPGWPPDHTHWATRTGFVMPLTWLAGFLNDQHLYLLTIPILITGIGKIVLCYFIGWFLGSYRLALAASMICSMFPVEIIYATHLYPDIPVSLVSCLTIILWTRACMTRSGALFALSGLVFMIGYLIRETVIFDLPILLAIFLFFHKQFTWKFAYFPLVVIICFLSECVLFGSTTGQPFYRITAILKQQTNPTNIELVQQSSAGGGFWLDPLLMAIFSQDFALFLALGLIASIFFIQKRSPVRVFAVWLLVGFLWFSYGSSSPFRWLPLQRSGRYFAELTMPCSILLGYWLLLLPRHFRNLSLAVTCCIAIFCVSLDNRDTLLSAHRALLASDYKGLAFEPFEYFGKRWADRFEPNPPYACCVDIGRDSVVNGLSQLHDFHALNLQDAAYLCLSPQRRPDLHQQLLEANWKSMASISAVPSWTRLAVGRALQLIPSQSARAQRILHPTQLVILKNPRVKSPGPNR